LIKINYMPKNCHLLTIMFADPRAAVSSQMGHTIA